MVYMLMPTKAPSTKKRSTQIANTAIERVRPSSPAHPRVWE